MGSLTQLFMDCLPDRISSGWELMYLSLQF